MVNKVVLIHATEIAIDPIVEAFSSLAPDIKIFHLLDSYLSYERSKSETISNDLSARLKELVNLAMRSNPDAILFTCSAFGESIEALNKSSSIPILKPNEAMFEECTKIGSPCLLLGTFTPAMEGMVQEYKTECEDGSIDSLVVEEARVRLKSGDAEGHNQLHINALNKENIDPSTTIMLAHFSSSIAKKAIESSFRNRVLSAPYSAVEKIIKIIGERNE